MKLNIFSNSNNKFYLPLIYMLQSRYKTTLDKFSWLLQRIIPVFIIIYYCLELDVNLFWPYLVIYIISEMIFISFYELGYIYNDTFTAKKEDQPTIRITPFQSQYLMTNFKSIVAFKSLIAIVLFLMMIQVSKTYDIYLNVYAFSCAIGVMLVSFSLHNYFRSIINILTFILLVFCKFSFAIILTIPVESLVIPILISMLMFPVPRVLENMCSKKFGLIKLQELIGDFDQFRVFYLAVALSLTFLMSQMTNIETEIFILIFSYFLVYRIASLILVRMSIHKR